MASPGELVRKVAEVLGVPEPTVTVHDRNLVTAGLRTKGGRGRSAAKMTTIDAANLLLAVAGSSMVKKTVPTVEEYADLPSRGGEVSKQTDAHSFDIEGNPPPTWELSGFPIPSLQALSESHGFRDALVALIEAAADGSLRTAIESLPIETGQGYRIPNPWVIQVIMWGHYPQAAVRIYCKGFYEFHNYADKIPIDRDAMKKWEEEDRRKYGGGDLDQIREFSAKTIFAIGDLLKS